jgi:hypothetical protein
MLKNFPPKIETLAFNDSGLVCINIDTVPVLFISVPYILTCTVTVEPVLYFFYVFILGAFLENCSFSSAQKPANTLVHGWNMMKEQASDFFYIKIFAFPSGFYA